MLGRAMAKLYFRHGTMDSAKTLNLLAVAHNYRKQGKRVLLLKPALDDRYGAGRIASRSGLHAEADLLVGPETMLVRAMFAGIDCVLVDEAQFLVPRLIEQLRLVSLELDIPVICYGLRTDFRTELFPGSARLLALADSIEEVKVTCQYCGRKAVFNVRHCEGRAVIDGDQVALGDCEYAPVCGKHYLEKVGDGLVRMGWTPLE